MSDGSPVLCIIHQAFVFCALAKVTCIYVLTVTLTIKIGSIPNGYMCLLPLTKQIDGQLVDGSRKRQPDLMTWLLSANCRVAVQPQMYRHESSSLQTTVIFIAFDSVPSINVASQKQQTQNKLLTSGLGCDLQGNLFQRTIPRCSSCTLYTGAVALVYYSYLYLYHNQANSLSHKISFVLQKFGLGFFPQLNQNIHVLYSYPYFQIDYKVTWFKLKDIFRRAGRCSLRCSSQIQGIHVLFWDTCIVKLNYYFLFYYYYYYYYFCLQFVGDTSQYVYICNWTTCCPIWK